MTFLAPPYKVTKAPVAPQKKTYLVTPCTFNGGPYNGQTRSMVVGEYEVTQPVLNVEWAGYRKGQYKLRPGTKEYVWVN